MDWGSLAGILLAIGGILIGQFVEGGSLSSLVQPAALLIVCCGTIGAVLLQSGARHFFNGVRMVMQVFVIPADNMKAMLRDLGAWSIVARREGLLSLERHADQVKDPFVAKGLRLIVDGVDPVRIREILEVDISVYEADQRLAVKVWESAGGYAPTIGILGAVLGLIHVMENLSDPSKLGAGIAVAFVATIYGVGLANLVFLPIANRLRIFVNKEIVKRELYLDIFTGIATGDNPRIIEERMTTFKS